MRKAWHWSWGAGGENRDSSDRHPHSPFLPGDICQLTLAPLPPHQVLTPQLISKQPALLADPNVSSLHPPWGSWDWVPGQGLRRPGGDTTNLLSPHRLTAGV